LLPQNKHFGTLKKFSSTKKLGAGYATDIGHRISLWVLIWPSDKFEFETPAVDQDLLLHRSHNLNIQLHVHGSINSCHTNVCAPLLGRWRTGALTPFTFQKRAEVVFLTVS